MTVTTAAGRGNCVSCFTYPDSTPPVLSGCPANASFQCLSQVPAPATVTALDNCDGSVPVSFSETQTNPGSSCNNTITRTWKATDSHGNTASCVETIAVNDTTPPTITCPPDITVASTAGSCAATGVNLGIPTTSDNCGSVTVSNSAPSSFPVGRTVVTWTATDACGNRSTCTQLVTVTRDVSITSNFNGTAIKAGNYIWFNSVLKPSGLGSSPVTIRFFHQEIHSANFHLSLPDAVITFDPAATTATTMFDGVQWVTRVPSSGLSGNTFLSGFAYYVPSNLPGGINPVTWSGSFVIDTPGVLLKWQWAAVYTNFSTDLNALGVKPVDDNHASQYQNSDHAGTPENYKSYVIGGARGGGGSNFTGSYSSTGSASICVPGLGIR
ncbi:MAG: HYR domain-containing protein [Acidobacteria bacterium]|nr:HYR domain-containing protein [Acidobacteriota bacterium]